MFRPLDDPGALPRTSYSETAPPAPDAPPLAGEMRADICIIGAGFTGLSAALHAAAAGAKAVVLEANAIGWGSSGRNFGQVVPYLKHEPWAVLRHLGMERGERLIRAAADGADLVFALIERHGMRCEAVRNGLIFAAHTPANLEKLRRRAAFWQSSGVELAVLDAAATAQAIGGGNYWGALVEPRGGTINSLAYARGLASAAVGAGAAVHGGSRVAAIERDGAAWRVRTGGGVVHAGRILICTNAYTDDLWPGLGRGLLPVRGYQLATEILPDNLRGGILPGGRALTDGRRLMSGVRLHPNGRLHVSGIGKLFGAERRPDYETSARRVEKLFPQLGRIDWAFHWSGWMAMTGDDFPHFHDLAPGVLAGLGYSGRGIALATMMGRELARGTMGTPADELLFQPSPVAAPGGVPFPPVARVGARAIAAGYRVRDAIDAVRHGRGPRAG